MLSVVLAIIVLFILNNLKDDDFKAYPDFKIVEGVVEKYYGTNENIVIPQGVKEIGECAFEDCETMTSVTIPDSVKAIDEGAFNGTNLKKVYIPKSVTYIDKNSFQCNDYVEIEVDPKNKKYSAKDGVLYNKDMTELIRYQDKEDIYYYKIPEGVEKIGNSAFASCGLTDIYIPYSVKEIGDYAFMGCRANLTLKVDEGSKYFILKNDIMFSKDMTELVWYSKLNTAKSYTIPHSITTIRAGAFEFCETLENITIPNSVKTIGDSAFRCVMNLKTLTIPDSVSEIGETPFLGTFRLPPSASLVVDENSKYFTLKDGILYNKEMTELVFCLPRNEITEVTVPKTVETIQPYAFFDCINLKKVKIPNSVVEIGEGAFSRCFNMSSINLPSKITSIADSSFQGCSSLGSIIIPDNIISIGDEAFSNCDALNDIKLPKNIQKIGKEAFADCINLKKVDIPASVSEIADNAFDGYAKLKGINVDAENKIYSSKEGVLFDKDMKRLIKYPAGNTNSHYAVPEGVKTILSNAFTYCEDLASLDVPISVEVISDYAFNSHDSNLTSINVDGNNKYYSSHDGVLYDKAKKKLIFYPYYKKEKEYEMPKGVVTIKKNAFIDCFYLQQLTIPKSVITIEEFAFNRSEQFSIKGYEYSAAFEFAASHHIPFVTVGE